MYRSIFAAGAVLLFACSPGGTPAPRPIEPGGDAGMQPAPTPAPPTSSELCANGVDDDRDALVDEGCGCAPGASQSCYLGDLAQAGVGACTRGSQTCVAGGEFGGEWGDCIGSGTPAAEICDMVDNDCNGLVDDGDGRCPDEPPPPVPPPTPPPPRCDAPLDVSPRGLGDSRVITGTTCGAADIASLNCAGAAAPEAYYTWTSPDEPYWVNWTVSPGFVVGLAQADEACLPGPFFCDSQDSSDYAHVHTLVVERADGGCGEFTLTVTRQR